MPVKKEMAMGTKHRKGYLRSKTSKFREGDMLSHGETAFPHQGRVLEGCSLKKGHRKVFSAEDEPANRLVKIELDVAEALAEFLRIAHLPHQRNIGGDCDAGLQWSGKRKRTMRPNKDVIDPSGLKKEPEDAHFSVKKNKQRDSDELESTMILPDGGKVSPPYESRSESPSSPLPSLQLACRTLLVGGGPPAKSAFHRVVPLGPVKKPCLLPVKTEIEEVHLESSAARPQKAAVRRKPRARKPTLRVAPVKMETLNEQDIDTKDLKGVGSQDLTVAESAVKSLANIASQLVELSQEVGLAVMSKPKAALTEEEKEARRLHRIQANRESARQTIRRKQILCEELTMKAASLTLENEGMKQKRDLLMQELYSLKGQNYHLKQQLEIGSSGNLGAKSVQLSLRMSSQPVGLPALQVPSLPCAGVPLHSFVWAVAVAQAVTANQPCLLNNNEMIDENFRKFTNDQSVQHQTTACVLSGMPPSNQVSITEVTEQKHSHNSNGICSPISTNLSKKEMSSTAVACVESCTLQSAGAPCDPDSASIDAQQGLESTNGVDSLRKPAGDVCTLARGSSYQPTAVLPFTSKCGLDDVHGTLMGSESMERYMGPQIAQSVSYGISCNGSSVRVPLKGPLQAGLYSGRKTYAAAMAAAEARRRRKELTRSKFSRSRASRLLHR